MDCLQREREQVGARTEKLIAQRDLLGTILPAVKTICAGSGGVCRLAEQRGALDVELAQKNIASKTCATGFSESIR